jgi:hypothetical protein
MKPDRFSLALAAVLEASRSGRPVTAGKLLVRAFEAIPSRDREHYFRAYSAVEKALSLVWEKGV